ncbi:MAG: rod shape-determining protein MreC [Gemmatimonadales bacterium]
MILAPERFASRRDTLAFVVCIILSVAARLSPVGAQRAVASGITSTVLAPFLAIQNQALLIRTSRERVERIVAERDSAALEALDIYALREDNARLRELVSLSGRVASPHVAAQILRQTRIGDALTLTLSAGRTDGVHESDPVITPAGLLGVILSVGSGTSVALVWTHPDFRASAMAEDGSVFGIVAPSGSEGPGTRLMELRGVPYKDKVPIGTRIYTSGLGTARGGVYPRGIPLGTVIAEGPERSGWSKTYILRPAVHPAAVSHVIILTARGEDIGAAFRTEVP